MRYAALALIIVLAFFTACQADATDEILPPQPPAAPGEENIAGQAYLAEADLETRAGFAPPWDIFNGEALLLKSSPETPQGPDGVELIVDHSGNDLQLTYRDAYIHNGDDWQELPLTGTESQFSGFLTGSIQTPIPEGMLGTGDNYAVIYACTAIIERNGQQTYACGCKSETDCGYWQLQRITVAERTYTDTDPAISADKSTFVPGEEITFTISNVPEGGFWELTGQMLAETAESGYKEEGVHYGYGNAVVKRTAMETQEPHPFSCYGEPFGPGSEYRATLTVWTSGSYEIYPNTEYEERCTDRVLNKTAFSVGDQLVNRQVYLKAERSDTTSACGDGTCSADEDAQTCPSDCTATSGDSYEWTEEYSTGNLVGSQDWMVDDEGIGLINQDSYHKRYQAGSIFTGPEGGRLTSRYRDSWGSFDWTVDERGTGMVRFITRGIPARELSLYVDGAERFTCGITQSEIDAFLAEFPEAPECRQDFKINHLDDDIADWMHGWEQEMNDARLSQDDRVQARAYYDEWQAYLTKGEQLYDEQMQRYFDWNSSRTEPMYEHWSDIPQPIEERASWSGFNSEEMNKFQYINRGFAPLIDLDTDGLWVDTDGRKVFSQYGDVPYLWGWMDDDRNVLRWDGRSVKKHTPAGIEDLGRWESGWEQAGYDAPLYRGGALRALQERLAREHNIGISHAMGTNYCEHLSLRDPQHLHEEVCETTIDVGIGEHTYHWEGQAIKPGYSGSSFSSGTAFRIPTNVIRGESVEPQNRVIPMIVPECARLPHQQCLLVEQASCEPEGWPEDFPECA